MIIFLLSVLLGLGFSSDEPTPAPEEENERTFDCANKFEKVCCAAECPYCGWCNKDNHEESFINGTYSNFYWNCCAEVILESNLTCNSNTTNASITIGPPCILDDPYTYFWEEWIDFFKNGPIYLIVIVSIILFGVALFLFYTCVIFGKRYPPLEYVYIVNSLKKLD